MTSHIFKIRWWEASGKTGINSKLTANVTHTDDSLGRWFSGEIYQSEQTIISSIYYLFTNNMQTFTSYHHTILKDMESPIHADTLHYQFQVTDQGLDKDSQDDN